MRSWTSWAGAAAAVAAAAVLFVGSAATADTDAFHKALAELDQAIATNPMGVSEASLDSCRAMRKTAELLYKMGKRERAVRRIEACRRLLRLDNQHSALGLEPRGGGG